MSDNYLIINGELYHYGVKGMKWGVRRYQNADGTLTDAGKKRYGLRNKDGSLSKKGQDKYSSGIREELKDAKYNFRKVLENHPELEKLYNRENLRAVRREFDAIERSNNEILDGFYNDPNKKEKYLDMLVKQVAERENATYDAVRKAWETQDESIMSKYFGEDESPFNLYIKENPRIEFVSGFSQRWTSLSAAYRRECQKAVHEFVNNNANEYVRSYEYRTRNRDVKSVLEGLLDAVHLRDLYERRYETGD